MSSQSFPVNQTTLVSAWNQTLPTILNDGDSTEIRADQAGGPSLHIHIETAGHSMYSFDFTCTYADEREVDVQLVNVWQEGHSTDTNNAAVKELIDDYTRHIHEAAQALQSLTHP